MRRVALAFPRVPKSVERIKGIDYWGDGEPCHALDIYRPVSAAENAPVLFYVHGGAWVMGDKREQGLPLMSHLASRGAVCVTANYRLSPAATWPDHLIDCKRALAWVHEHISEYGGDPSRVVVAGASAGGHLAALLALTQGEADYQPGFEEADTSTLGCIGLYGVYDFCTTDDGGVPDLRRLLERDVLKRRFDDDSKLFESASPISLVSGDAPPFFVLHGRNDTLVPVATARAFVAALSSVSRTPVVYAEMPMAQHAFELLWSMRTSAMALAVDEFFFTVTSPLAPS